MLNKTVSLFHFIESILCALLINQFFQNCQSARLCSTPATLLPVGRRPNNKSNQTSVACFKCIWSCRIWR